MSVEDWTEIVFAALIASVAVLGSAKILPGPEYRLVRALLAAVFAAGVMLTLNLLFK